MNVKKGLAGIFIFVIIGITISSCKCSTSNFSGVSKTRPPTTGGPTGEDAKGVISRTLNSVTSHKIWIVTKAGVAKRLTLEGNEVKETRSWSGLLGTGGTRTYVTEGGLIAARFPNIYFIDPDGTPQGPIPASNKKVIPEGGNRICLASYKRGDKRFMLAAWGKGEYREFPLADTPPYRPMWDGAASHQGTLGLAALWGYSCFIDQKRMVFYSQYGGLGALGLNTMQKVNPESVAPNAKFVSVNIPPLTKGIVPSSYSIAGDANGNIINGVGLYTASHDPISDTIWVSRAEKIGVYPASCFSSTPNCAGFAEYDPPAGGIGPMSALKDGRIIGATRYSGNIYVMSLNNPADRTAGINVTKIASVGGDPYMYTDFTGATLYVSNAEQTFDFGEAPGFVPDKPVVRSKFRWTAKGGASAEWKSMKVEIRCYNDGAAKPEFVEVGPVGSDRAITPINSPSCAGKKINRADVRVSQLDNASTMVGVERIEVLLDQ